MNSQSQSPREGSYIPYAVQESSSGEYDVVIVGAGHHGLTAAAFLARAGKRVLVLESRPVIGGMCWTEDMENAPGYRRNPCALEVLLMGTQPSILDQLELHKYGLKFIYPTVLTSGLNPGGRHVTFYPDLERTVQQLKTFSAHDAESYRRMVNSITWAMRAAIPYLMGPATRPRPQAIWEILKVLLKGRKEVAEGARILLSPLETMLNEHFENDAIKATLGCWTLANFSKMSDIGSGIYLTVLTGIHNFGVKRPVGGTGQIARALAVCATTHGGEIRVNAPVDKIIVRNGKATGVALKSGEEIKAKQVIGSVDPVILGTKLIEASDLPRSTHMQLEALKGNIAPINVVKIDLALRKRPTFSGFGHENLHPEVLGGVTLPESTDELRAIEDLCAQGTYDKKKLALITYMPSIFDRTLVPDNSEGEYMYINACNVPYKLSEGRSWENHLNDYVDGAIDTVERYAPGFRDLIIDVHAVAPDQFEKKYNNFRGNYAQVNMSSPSELGPWRPIPDFGNNKTPIDGLWNASAGSHPVPYLNGWAGRIVAGEILKILK